MQNKLNIHMHSVLSAHGGAARVLNLLANGFLQKGHTVTTSCEIEDQPIEDQPNELSDKTVAPATKNFPTKISPAQLGALVQENKSSICHLHSTQSWSQACASFMAMGQKHTPVCITLHDCSLLTGGCINPLNCKGWRNGCFDPCPLNFANAPQAQAEKRKLLQALKPALTAPSGWLCRMVKELGLACKHIPNGVEDNLLNPEFCRASIGVSPQARMVLFVAHGGLQALGKGAASWVRIWQSIKSQMPQAVCFMVGGEEIKKEKDLVYWPYVDLPTMQKLLLAADLLVYPSLADNHPLVVLEAMSAGTPVCAYAVGGVIEQVRTGQNQTGILVTCGDEAALSAAALQVLTNPGLAREMGINAKNVFERHFQAEQMVNKYLGFYQSLVTL